MDLSEKERVEKAALRKRRQQGVAAGTSRFAELEQAVQEIRMNTLQVCRPLLHAPLIPAPARFPRAGFFCWVNFFFALLPGWVGVSHC